MWPFTNLTKIFYLQVTRITGRKSFNCYHVHLILQLGKLAYCARWKEREMMKLMGEQVSHLCGMESHGTMSTTQRVYSLGSTFIHHAIVFHAREWKITTYHSILIFRGSWFLLFLLTHACIINNRKLHQCNEDSSKWYNHKQIYSFDIRHTGQRRLDTK